MRITVVADDSGTVIAAVHHPNGESLDDHPQGCRVVPQEGQSVVTMDAPGELAEREFGAEFFEALRGYVVRDKSLVARD
jgi:hypothetical protein